MSALHFAANAGHLDVVKVLLAAKANIHALDEVPHFTTPLPVTFAQYSMRFISVQLSTAILDANSCALYCPQNGSTPFHWAAANCHLDVAEALLAAGANIDAADNVRSHYVHCPYSLPD
jgi:ankyrin repeat protein